MKAYEIINYLENYFPLELQMDFDCCGLQIGNRNKEIKKVYIALNADNETLQACLDRGKNGISMNDWLVNQLGVHGIECYDHYEVGKKAILNQPMEGNTFIKKVKETFHLEHVKYSKNTNKTIEKIAICGGSAADDLEILADQVDCYITGDSKYRHAKYAIDHDCLLIDPGHHLEVIFEK